MIGNTQLIEILKSRLACTPAIKWLQTRNSDEMWTKCNRPDWLLWWAAPYVPRKTLVLILCQCARLALPHVAAGELRPLRAIETAEAWTRGEATLEEVMIAAYAADVAASAAYAINAAYASAYAAASAASAAFAAADRAAYTAASAAYAAAYAADVSASAAYATNAAYASAYAAYAADVAAQSQMCKLIRHQWPICPEPEVQE